MGDLGGLKKLQRVPGEFRVSQRRSKDEKFKRVSMGLRAASSWF